MAEASSRTSKITRLGCTFTWKTYLNGLAPAYVGTAVTQALRRGFLGIPLERLRELLRKKQEYRLTVSFLSKKQIQKINAEYRGKDKPTDVLSFSQIETPSPVPTSELGEILICWDVARAQHKEFGTTLRGEAARLTVHGLLHVFGYDHERSKKEAVVMRRLEDRILSTIARHPRASLLRPFGRGTTSLPKSTRSKPKIPER